MGGEYLSKNFISPNHEELDAFLVINHNPSLVATKGGLGQVVLNKQTGKYYRKLDNGVSQNWLEVYFPFDVRGYGFGLGNIFFQDFIINPVGNISSGFYFGEGYSFFASGTRALGQNGQTPNSHKEVGIFRMRVGTSGAGVCYTGMFSQNPSLLIKMEEGLELYSETKLSLRNLGNPAQSLRVVSGFLNDFDSTPQNGVFFRYQTNVNDGKWEIVSSLNSTQSVFDSGVVADTNFIIFGIKFKFGVAQYFINGNIVGEITENLPDGSVGTLFSPGTSFQKLSGNGNYSVDLDYILTTMRFLNGR